MDETVLQNWPQDAQVVKGSPRDARQPLGQQGPQGRSSVVQAVDGKRHVTQDRDVEGTDARSQRLQLGLLVRIDVVMDAVIVPELLCPGFRADTTSQRAT